MSAVIETPNRNAAMIDLPKSAQGGQVRQPPRSLSAELRRRGHQLVVRGWRHTPTVFKRLAVRVMMPKVTLGVCGIVHDPAGRVLLAHHTYRPQPWDLPGGFMRSHEQPTEALARELREELGVQILVGPLVASALTGSHLTLYYQAMMAGKPEVDGVELDDWRFVNIAEIPDLMGKSPNWLAWVNPSRALPARRDGEQTSAGD